MILIESMVALAIFSIALLSLSGLQLNATRGAFSSLLKTESAVSSAQIIDKMRINLAGVAAGDYTIAFGDTVNPSATTVGERDVALWINDLQGISMAGSEPEGSISCLGFNCTVQIRWFDSRTAQSFSKDENAVERITYTFDVNL